MRRLILAALFWALTAAGASAACPGPMADCPAGPNTRSDIAPAGIHADAVISAAGALVSGTSDDVTLAALVATCSASGGRIKLPAGKILMDGTGGQSITLNNCALEGTGVPSVGNATGGNGGTMFVFTSLTVRPFTCGKNWALVGINFYWPGNTTGAVAYPPFMSDDGVNLCGDAYIDKTVFVNPYQAFVQGAANSWENFIVSNSILYATKDFFALKKTGGSFVINNILGGPGPWFNLCPPCKASGGTNASRNASFLHALNNGGGQGLTLAATEHGDVQLGAFRVAG